MDSGQKRVDDLYIEAVHQLCVRDRFVLQYPLPVPALGREFRNYLNCAYEHSKDTLEGLRRERADRSRISDQKLCIFVYAAGLLAYGRRDVAMDILAGIPEGSGHVRRLAWS